MVNWGISQFSPTAPMLTKTKRRVLLWLTVALFFVIAIPTLVYSIGYRFNGSFFQLSKTGGIYIQTSLPDVIVYLDDKKEKSTSRLYKGIFITSLSPGTHLVRAEKENYFSWEKQIAVAPETVQWRDAILIPKNPEGVVVSTTTPPENISVNSYTLRKGTLYQNGALTPEAIFSSVKNYWLLPKENSLLLLGEDGSLYQNKERITISTSSPRFLNATGDSALVLFGLLATKKNSIFDDAQSRIIYWDAHTIGGYWFADEDKMPQWQQSRSIHIFTAPAIITYVISYPRHGDYLLVISGGAIQAVEMDSQGHQNVFPIYKGKSPVILQKNPDYLLIQDDKFYFQINLP